MNELVRSIVESLERHPHMAARIRAMLDIAENTSGSVELAKDAENMVIEEITKMGNELLTTWGKTQETKKRKIYEEKAETVRHGKKKPIGKQG